MQFSIEYRGREAGTVQVEEGARGLTFAAACPLQTEQVLRLYCVHPEKPDCLRIGVLEPEGTGLGLHRAWGVDQTRRLGLRQMPTRYFLSDGAPGCEPGDLHTPDAPPADGLQPAFAHGAVRWEPAEGPELAGYLTAPFVPGQANALAAALTGCTICPTETGYTARLPWKKSWGIPKETLAKE